jgi:ATP-dependent 26S proteasome regulatory subunit
MTTNHPDSLDPALIRPGRINTKLHLDYMSDKSVIAMFAHHFAEATAAEKDKLLHTLAIKRQLSTHGFKMSGAEVEQLCAECDSVEEFITELDAYPRLHKDLRALMGGEDD